MLGILKDVTLTSRRATDHARTSPAVRLGLGIVVVAWMGALAAPVWGTLTGTDWSNVLRLVVTGFVYAPVAAIVLAARQTILGAIVGSLALLSGVLSFGLVLNSSIGGALDSEIGVLAVVARQPEVAALGILPWLLVHSAPRWRRWGIGLGCAAIVLDLGMWAAQGAEVDIPRSIAAAPLAVALVSLLGASGFLVAQWRAGSARERATLNWFAVGAGLLFVSYARVVVELPELVATLCDVAFVLAQGILPTAILAVVVGGHSLGRDRRLLRGVTWVQSLAFAVALYLLVNTVLTMGSVPTEISGAFAAAVLALTFSPLLHTIRLHTDRLYFGDGAGVELRDVVSTLGDRLSAHHEPDGSMRTLAESLRDTWQLASVTITSDADDRVVCVGEPAAISVVTELSAGDRRVGTVELTSDSEQILRYSVAPVLGQVAPLLAVALLLTQANQELTVVRRRTLGVRREERRMMRRELHDELAPALAGIGFGMAAAKRLLERDSPKSVAAVAGVRADVAARAEDVRRLARSLLPAALDAGDVSGALRELAQRFTGSGVTVELEAGVAADLDPDVQVTLYLAASEAVSRLRQIEGIRHVTLATTLADEHVVLTVTATLDRSEIVWDRGILSAVSERAADIGGTARVDVPDHTGAVDEGLRTRLVVEVPR